MIEKRKNVFYCILLFVFIFYSCNSDYTFKPRGYFKIELPVKAYQKFDQPGYPYSFEYPVYATIVKDSTFFEAQPENPWWINIDLPRFGGRIYISYKEIGRNKLDSLVNDAFEMAYKQHTYKASSIEPIGFVTPNKISGVYFTLTGNTATANQFFLTDSVKHFLRGALYFSATPNEDSISIVNNFLRADMEHLINTLKWK
jgi:gliding motility-associated lipoprotein GldD